MTTVGEPEIRIGTAPVVARRRAQPLVAALGLMVALVGYPLAETSLAQTAKELPPPGRTTWKPRGCRAAGSVTPLLAPRSAWRALHSDELNSDEVEVAYAPVFAADWVGEPMTWNPTGPVFDSAGNVYFAPFNPHEAVVLVSLDAATGARRFAVPNSTGTPAGSGAPLVLRDPDVPGAEIVYHGRYDRVLAVRTDGTVLWEQPTGLTGTPSGGGFGVNHLPAADALVGLTRDGFLYAVDRATGAVLLDPPFQLPGAPSPAGPPLTLPPDVLACTEAELARLADLKGQPISLVVDVLRGNGVEVANFFSIDPATGRLWVAATAPDEEDGTLDGVSQRGALYGLDLVADGAGGYDVVEACHASFAGGSASTPALRRDGSRIYVGDNGGNLIALDRSCAVVWTIALPGQITGSIGVAADNGEIYASTSATIFQVIDEGDAARIGWAAALDVFELLPGQEVANQTIAGIAANAIAFQAGAVQPLGTSRLAVTTGVGLLDRATGAVRSFAPGLDESVAVMSTGPDGALYTGNSPLRRLFAYCLAQAGIIGTPVAPPLGGLRKYLPTRPDLELRDAACAAADRAANAQRERRRCSAAARAADLAQLGILIAQSDRARAQASAAGLLPAREAERVRSLLALAETRRGSGQVPRDPLGAACRSAQRHVARAVPPLAVRSASALGSGS